MEEEPYFYEFAQHKSASNEQYISCCYDIECEQERDGLPLLLCFMLVCSTGLLEVVGSIPYYVDNGVKVFYFRGLNCIQRFQCFLYKLTAIYPLTYLVAHNGNKFDHLYVLNKIQDVGFKIISCLSKPTSIKEVSLKGQRGVITTKDSYCFASSPLSAFTCEAGSKLDFDPSQFTLATYEQDAFLQYCARDCHILTYLWHVILPKWYSPIVPILSSYKRGFASFMSQAHIAYNQLIASSKFVYKICGTYYQYGSYSYYGAKCDSMIYGSQTTTPVKGFDLTSMYPACMNAPMPHGKYKFKYHFDVDWENFNCYETNPFVCTVKMYKKPCKTLLEAGYGIVPCHTRRQRGKIYGNCKQYSGISYVAHGTVEGVYTSVDLQAFILDGWTILSADYFLVWDEWTNQYSVFYDQWFKIKSECKQSDPDKYWFSKIILNSSIGKFAQKPFDGDNTKPSYLGWFCLSGTRLQQYVIKHWAMTANLTAIYYGDTDSIFMDQDVLVPLEWLDKKLGKPWEITGDYEANADFIIVCGKKLYALIKNWEIIKCGHKGLKKMDLGTYVNCMNGLPVHQTTCSPERYFQINNGCINSGVTKFYNGTKRINKTIPLLKFKSCNFYLNKFLK